MTHGGPYLSSSKEVLKHSTYLLAARLFVRLASLPFMLYMAARLRPELFGTFTFVLVTVEILSSLGDVGLTRYGARAIIRADMGKDRLAGIFFSIQVITSVVLMALAYSVLFIAAPDGTKKQLFMIAFLALFFSSFIYTTETLFTAEKRFGASSVFQVLGKAVYLALGLAALASGYSVLAVMAAYITGMAVESVLRMAYMWRRVTQFSGGYTVAEFRDVALGTLPFAVSGVAVLLYYRADTIILGLIKSDFEVGIYSAAYSVFTFFFWIPVIVSRTLMPGLIERYKQNPRESLRSSVNWFSHMTLLGVAIAFSVTVMARTFIDMLLPEGQYEESILVLQILIWSIPVLMMVSVTLNTLIMAGQERVGASITVITTVAIIVLDLALIPAYGVNGAAVAMAAATALWAGQLVWFARRSAWMELGSLTSLLAAPLTAAVAVTAVGLTLYRVNAFLALAAGLAACGLVAMADYRSREPALPERPAPVRPSDDYPAAETVAGQDDGEPQ